jgi:drug/metabolite transporter (DMT)-like permease
MLRTVPGTMPPMSTQVRSPRRRSASATGALFCIASGAAFGAMAVFGKLAYDEGATVGTLLGVRFTLAAVMFWVLVPLREIRALPGREIRTGLALGAGGYALQAGCYFVALGRIEAPLLGLLLYTFPALVAVAAVALGRERFGSRHVIAVCLAGGGLTLALAGASDGALDPLGVALGLGAALVYSAYILVSDPITRRVRPQLLATLVCTGAAATLLAGSIALGEFRPGELTAAGWGWLLCLAAVSTVTAISLFFAGLERVGPTMAAILSTVEPLVTILLAFVVLGERLGAMQLLGGALVLAAVVPATVTATRAKIPVTLR